MTYRPMVGDVVVSDWGDWGIVEGVYYGGINQEDFVEIKYVQSETEKIGVVGRFKISHVHPIAASPKRKNRGN